MESENTAAPPAETENKADASSKGGGKKLDKLLDRLHDSANGSRENSPDPAKAKEKSSGSSRRKPKVTRKVVEDDKPQAVEIESSVDTFETNSFDYIDSLLGSAREPSPEPEIEPLPVEEPPPDPPKEQPPQQQNGNVEPMQIDDDTPQVIEDSNNENFVIPEGTVVVHPEAVEEKRPTFKGPEWKQTKKTSRGESLGSVLCTACNKQINTNKEGSAKRHPVLKVLICKKCYNWYTSAEIEQDEDGMDEQCRWCGEGGNLICCDFCHNAFCKSCIKRNLGRKEMSGILDAGDDVKWKCYVCDPKPMAKLIQEATETISSIEKTIKENKDKDSQKRSSSRTPKAAVVSSKVSSGATPNLKQTARKSTTPQPMGKALQIQNIVQNVHNSLSNNLPIISNVQGATPVFMIPNQGGGQKIVKGRVIGQGKAIPYTQQQKQTGNQKQYRNQIPHVQPTKPTRNQPSPGKAGEWDVNINEFNVCQVLDRTLAATESMRMVLSSFKDELKKGQRAGHAPFVNAKRDVSRKLRRAMGAFKKQIQDIEFFTRAFQASRVSTSNRGKPQPLGLINKQQAAVVQKSKRSPQKGGEVVVILSDSDDDDEDDKSPSKDKAETKSPEKKKAFSMKVRLGGGDKDKGGEKEKDTEKDDDDAEEKDDPEIAEVSDAEKDDSNDAKDSAKNKEKSDAKDKDEEKKGEEQKEEDEVMVLDSSIDETIDKEDKKKDDDDIMEVDADEEKKSANNEEKDQESDKDDELDKDKEKISKPDADKGEIEKDTKKTDSEKDASVEKSPAGKEKDEEEEDEKSGEKEDKTSKDKTDSVTLEDDKEDHEESEVDNEKDEKADKKDETEDKDEAQEKSAESGHEEAPDEPSDNNEGNEVSDTEFQAILSEVTAAITSQIESSDGGGHSDVAAGADSSAMEEDHAENDTDDKAGDSEGQGDDDKDREKSGFESLQFEPLFDASIDSEKEGTDKEGSSKRRRSKDVDEADDSEEPGPSKRSRANLEAQRQLHRELLDGTGSSGKEEGDKE